MIDKLKIEDPWGVFSESVQTGRIYKLICTCNLQTQFYHPRFWKSRASPACSWCYAKFFRSDIWRSLKTTKRLLELTLLWPRRLHTSLRGGRNGCSAAQGNRVKQLISRVASVPPHMRMLRSYRVLSLELSLDVRNTSKMSRLQTGVLWVQNLARSACNLHACGQMGCFDAGFSAA